MPFPGRLLNHGEQVVVDVRPHWWSLAVPVVTFLVTLAGALAAAVEAAPTVAAWAAVAGLALAGGWLLLRYARWSSTRLVVTTSRIISRTGLVVRRGREIPLTALTDIGYRQGLWERMIGTGTVLLESAGRGQEVLTNVPRPAWVHNEIGLLLDEGRRRPGPAVAPTQAASIPQQIQELDALRRRGLITDSEFAAKKAQLLERM
jgi:membrane protein YdbS with pleckstrin-like domain